SSFAFVKATEGASYTNPWYAQDASGARAAHLVVGGYAFARPALPMSTAVDQAKRLASVVGNVRTAGTFPPVLDLEVTGGLAPAQLVTWAQTFVEAVRSATGRTPIVYSYPYFWRTAMAASPAFGRYPLWLASYSSTAPAVLPGWSAYSMWQYTSSASVPGIAGAADMSRWTGTAAAFSALADGTHATTWTVTAPAAPHAVTGTAGIARATVGWQPSDDGGQVPASFTVTAAPGGASVTVPGSASSAVVTGLTPGKPYTFTVRATNSKGTSAASAPTATVVPGQVPGVPTKLAVTSTASQVGLSWAVPAGAPTRYLLHRCTPAPCTPSATVLATVSTPSWTDRTATNGLRYAYSVSAGNAFGTSAASAPVTAAPVGPAPAPTSLALTPGDTSLTATWKAPVSNGGAALTGYAVRVDGGAPVTVAPSTLRYVAGGLAKATRHTLSVAAVNGYGTGAAASAAATTTGQLATALRLSGPTTVMSAAPATYSVVVTRSGTTTPVSGAAVVLRLAPRAGTAVSVRLVTDATGRAHAVLRPVTTATVSATLPATSALAASSASVGVAVRPVVTAGLTAARVSLGHWVGLNGATSPLFAGERVYRQVWVGGAWRTYATAVLDGAGRYHFGIKPTVAAVYRYRVLLPGTALHVTGGSPTVTLTAG
ncbi:MAG: GH25 family lysozyme, partial [Mycobacteriales bacterium]